MTIEMVKLYECGYCTHPEKIVNPKGSLKPIKFPATVALLKHSHYGYILFDTGYAARFFQATKRFPYSVYAKLTPVSFCEDKAIKNQLRADGIEPEAITTIILSHFHGDHIAGLKDFPHASILTFKKAYEAIRHLSKFRALIKGCLLELLPDDLEDRLRFIDESPIIPLNDKYGKFTGGYRVFDDDSILAVDLTGHAIGQFGIFVSLASGKRLFLCADAVWLSEAYQQCIYPHKIADLLIADKRAYLDNIMKLHSLMETNQEIDILPTHCHVTWEKARTGYIYE
ncbi:MBL fold metallo-hydrolase [Bacillaceae bacterium Marseille-Q3522]|nr:MBL fold metallo-hydrolase [Bacillaceae bacterium Marseille-Q3522]